MRAIEKTDEQIQLVDYKTAQLYVIQKALRIAGWHSNIRDYIRICKDSGISNKSAENAWNEGLSDRTKGNQCHCYFCRRLD